MTISEENYIKIIYHLSPISPKGVNTNAIAEMLKTKASSVTDMLKKLSDKKLVNYQKYYGVVLTSKGLLTAKMIIRRQRLWEVFLVEKLAFSWEEVHEIAEELEHIKSIKLINKLDTFLGFPDFDPHGDPIPDKNGEIKKIDKLLLSEGIIDVNYQCFGVKDTSNLFLQYLNNQNIKLGTDLKIVSKESFDNSLTIELANNRITISNQIASNIFIKTI